MSKTFRRSVFALAIILMATIMLVACSKKDDKSKDEETPDSTAVAVALSAKQGDISDEDGTITVVASENGKVTFTVKVDNAGDYDLTYAWDNAEGTAATADVDTTEPTAEAGVKVKVTVSFEAKAEKEDVADQADISKELTLIVTAAE